MKFFFYLVLHSVIISLFYQENAYSQKLSTSSISDKNPKEKIIWLVEDKKENIDLLAKKTPDTSTASYIESSVISQLTQYDVELSRGSMTRAIHYLKTKDNVCVANRFNLPERREYSIFSNPQSFYISHKLYRYNQSTPLPKLLFNTNGEIKSIPAVFKALPQSTIGAAQAVSFGPFLDKQIEQLDAKNVYYRGGTNRVTALEAMLYKDRIQLLLALPFDVNPTSEQSPLLEQYTIEGNPPYSIAHINCSDSELGHKVIKDINKILASMYKTSDYYLAHRKWFPENELEELQRFLKDNFSNDEYITPNQ